MGIVLKLLEKNWENCGKSDAKRIAAQTPASGIEQRLDIPYIGDGTREHLLDIYYPEGTAAPLPVIIDIHGGGWMYGYKEINKNFCLRLASKGFLVASLNYRLAPDCLLDGQLRDIFAGFKWLGENLKNYPADTDNVFLAGDSAGGHFACLCAAINQNPEMLREFSDGGTGLSFRAVGAICPAVDLSRRADPMGWAMRPIILGKEHKNSPYCKYLNAAELLSAELPPFFIVTASGDFLRSHALLLAENLKSKGARYKIHDFGDMLDGKKLGHVFQVSDPYSVYGEQANTEMTDFFREYMKKGACGDA